MLGIIAGVVGSIVTAAVSVSKVLVSVGLAVQGLKMIGNAIGSIAKALGIIKPERDVEELGDRALQAEEQGITPDQYSSYAAWVRDIEKDDWGYDPEKNKDMDPEKKIEKGVEVSSGVAIESFPELPIQEFLTLAGTNQDFFTMDRMAEIGKLANTDVDAFGKIINYVTGAAKDHTSINDACDIMIDLEKIIEPGISDDQAYDKVAEFYSLKK